MKTSRKSFLAAVAVAVIIFIGCFFAVFTAIPANEDYFDITFTPEGVYNYNILHHAEKGADSAAGEYTISPFMMLKAGEYNVKLDYKTQNDVPLYVYCLSDYDTDTKVYPKMQIATLSAGSTSVETAFTLDKEVKHVILVMEYPGETELSMQKCTVKSTEPLYKNRVTKAFAGAVTALAVYILFMVLWNKTDRNKKIAVAVMLVAMIAVSSAGLLSNTVVLGDDLEFHMIRLLGIGENIADGVPFSRVNYVFNGGYGYLNPVFYPQLFLWPFGLLTAFGADAVCVYKILIFAINIATVVISFTSFKKISNCRVAALICTAVYTLNYYRIGNIYVRGAVGELLYLVFLPLVFRGIYEIFHNNEEKWYILAIGAACVLQSHILGTLLTALGGAVLIAYYLLESIVRKGNLKKQITAMVKAGVATVCASATFLLPIVYYLRQPFYMFDAIDSVHRFSSFARSLYEMLFKVNNFDYINIISHLGTNTTILFAVVAVFAVIYVIKNKRYHESVGLVLIAAAFLVAASELMPWDVLGRISIVEMVITKLQFSFRLNTLTVMFLTLACAALLKDAEMPALKPMGAVLSAVLVTIGCGFYLVTGYETVRGFDGSYAVNATSPAEYFMEDAAYHEEITRTDKFRGSEGVEVVSYSQTAKEMLVQVDNSAEEGWVDVPVLYYSGYSAQDNSTGQSLVLTTGENFVVRVMLPQGSREISIKYTSKLIFTMADIFSLVFVILFALYIIFPEKAEKLKCKFIKKTVKN